MFILCLFSKDFIKIHSWDILLMDSTHAHPVMDKHINVILHSKLLDLQKKIKINSTSIVAPIAVVYFYLFLWNCNPKLWAIFATALVIEIVQMVEGELF